MAEFKIGSKVKAKSSVLCDHHGEVGIIVDANESGYPVDVEFDDGIIEGFEEYELELAQSDTAAPAAPDHAAADALPVPDLSTARLLQMGVEAADKVIALQIELSVAQERIAALEAKLETEREAWIDIQRRVQDAKDALRWRDADNARLADELAAARRALETVEEHLSAIQDYVFAPDASSGMHGMVSQAMAAQDVITEALEAAAAQQPGEGT